MSCKKLITFLIIFSIGLSVQNAKAQEFNITGDTVFVNMEAEIQIKFPTIPNSFNTVPINAPYSLRSEQTSLIITGKLEDSRPAVLSVSEGGRTHHFTLIFKKDIDYNNNELLFKDYGTVKKLKEHVQATASRKTIKTEKATVISEVPEVPVKANPSLDNDNKYTAITNDAKAYLDQKKYIQAKEAYQQALALKPGDLYATHQLETISKLELEENGQRQQQASGDLYADYMALGEKAYGKNEFTEARIAYEQALTVRKNDALATSRLKLVTEKEKAQKESEELENNYNTAIQAANTLFQAGDLEGAKAEYTKAIGFIKKPLPLDQIKKIDKTLAERAEKDNIEKQKEAQRVIAERQEKEKRELETNYSAAVQSADAFFKTGDYENAKIEYNKALDFIKKDWPREQINKINQIKADQVARENSEKQQKQKQELEHRYNAAMEAADKYFQASDYANAKIMYNRALSLIPGPLPQDKIKEINKIIADQVAQQNAEKLRLEHEAEITSRYTAILKNADTEFDKKNYIKAKQLYTQASGLKPAEAQPKDRLNIIESIFAKTASELKAKNDSIALAKETGKKYNLALSQGKSSYRKNDFLNAKIFYEEATKLKPSEEEPKNQLKVVVAKLAEIERQNEITNSYNRYIVLADSQLLAKSYDSALNTYNVALQLKPSELYPKQQIKFVQAELAENERRKEIIKRQETERRYNQEITDADNAVADKKYEEARSLYTDALTIHPENTYARRRLDIIIYQIEKKRTDSLNQAALNKNNEPVKSKGKKSRDKTVAAKPQEKPPDNHLAFQANPIPYSYDELKNKYPDINFLVLPPEQPFNTLAVSSKENLHIYDTLLLQKPRLDLASGDQGIKLIVEGISFEETTAYVKVLIQNNSNTDFLTGAMMLTWTKKSGNHIKLYPNHLFPSPLPVIKPAFESVVIYVCKTYNILDDDLLTFEMIDRFKKIKLEVNIPGSAYNKEWVRYE